MVTRESATCGRWQTDPDSTIQIDEDHSGIVKSTRGNDSMIKTIAGKIQEICQARENALRSFRSKLRASTEGTNAVTMFTDEMNTTTRTLDASFPTDTARSNYDSETARRIFPAGNEILTPQQLCSARCGPPRETAAWSRSTRIWPIPLNGFRRHLRWLDKLAPGWQGHLLDQRQAGLGQVHLYEIHLYRLPHVRSPERVEIAISAGPHHGQLLLSSPGKCGAEVFRGPSAEHPFSGGRQGAEAVGLLGEVLAAKYEDRVRAECLGPSSGN